MWTLFQAVANCERSKPLGQRAIGWRSVSRVGVTADLSIHRIGPRPTISRKISIEPLRNRMNQRTRFWLRSAAETMPAVGRARGGRRTPAPRQPHESTPQRRVSQ